MVVVKLLEMARHNQKGWWFNLQIFFFYLSKNFIYLFSYYLDRHENTSGGWRVGIFLGFFLNDVADVSSAVQLECKSLDNLMLSWTEANWVKFLANGLVAR